MAKTTTYVGSPSEIFDIAEATTAQTYKIGEVQRSGPYALITAPQWYNPEGGRQSAGQGDFVQLVDRSILLQLLVEVVPTSENTIVVNVTPRTYQHLTGSPKPRELAPDDPNVPGWVLGRVDTLHHEIHKRLQKYVAK